MAGIAFLRKLLMKKAMKESAPFQHEGIMSISKSLSSNVDTKVKRWVESAKKQGQDIDKMGEQEIKYIIELNKPKGPTILGHPVIDATSPEGKGITQDLFNMLDRQSGKNVIKTDFGGGITDIVTETITKIKVMKPIDGMKEANSVLARKGKYKNLTEEQSQKIIKDTEDHIFERNIKPDPEDFAHGGRTGSGLNYLLGEDDQNSRVPFGAGGFNAARRAFLKLTGGAAAGVGAAKSGLLGLLKGGGKKEVIEEVVKQSAGSGTPPAYFFNLVRKIKNLGDDVTETGALAERQNVKTYKDYTLTEDTVTGRQEIQRYKTSEEATHYGQPLTEETYMSYTPGEIISQGTKKGKPKVVKTQPEYDEGTAYIRNDGPSTGEIVDESSVISKEVVQEGTIFEDTIAEFTKKASGGRVPLGEGGDPGTSSAEEVREAWKDYLKEKEKGTFRGSWQEWQPIWIRANLAQGGRVPLAGGKGVMSLIELITKKFGKDTAKRASELGRPKSALEREMFQNFNKKLKPGKDEVIIEEQFFNQKTGKTTTEHNIYKKSDKNRPPTEDEIEDYMDELPHGNELGWNDFGNTIDDLDNAVAEARAYERQMYDDYKTGKLDKYMSMEAKGKRVLDADDAGRPSGYNMDEEYEIRAAMEEAERIKIAKMNEADELAKPKKTVLSDDDFNVTQGLDDLENMRGTKASEIMRIKMKYPGISDDLIRKIMTDDNPQRKAEVFATMDEAFKMQEKGMGHEEIIETFKGTTRTKNASGGRVSLSAGGLAGMLGE